MNEFMASNGQCYVVMIYRLVIGEVLTTRKHFLGMMGIPAKYGPKYPWWFHVLYLYYCFFILLLMFTWLLYLRKIPALTIFQILVSTKGFSTKHLDMIAKRSNQRFPFVVGPCILGKACGFVAAGPVRHGTSCQVRVSSDVAVVASRYTTAMENPPFVDVFPIGKGVFPLLC